jgi:hypothetical protein
MIAQRAIGFLILSSSRITVRPTLIAFEVILKSSSKLVRTVTKRSLDAEGHPKHGNMDSMIFQKCDRECPSGRLVSPTARMETMNTSHVIGLRFQDAEGLRKAIEVYEEGGPGLYLATVGKNTVVVLKNHAERVQSELGRLGYESDLVTVKSLAEVAPERADEIRGVRRRNLLKHFDEPGHRGRIRALDDELKKFGL